MRIGIDLDGVCYSFTRAVAEYALLHTGETYTHVPTDWNFYEDDWGMTFEDFRDLVDQGVDDRYIFRIGRPLPDTRWALQRLQTQGHTLHIVTDRSYGTKSQENTIEWLTSYNIPYDTLTFTADKTSVHTDMFIDDRPKNVEALRAIGVEAYLNPHDGIFRRKDQLDSPYFIEEGWEQFVFIVETRADAERLLTGEYSRQDEVIIDRNTGEWVPPVRLAEVMPDSSGVLRTFDSGATRDTDANKLDYEGFISGPAWRRFAEYMHTNRVQSDGTLRASDNWQKGIPFDAYMKSMFRHFMEVWENHRTLVSSDYFGEFPEDYDQIETDLCALLFNVQGYLHEVLKSRTIIPAGLNIKERNG